MLKRLAILAMFLVGPNALVALPLNPQRESQSTSHPEEATSHNPIPPQPTVNVNCINGNNGDDKKQEKDGVAEKPKPDYAAWGFWVNVILVPITLLVAGAAVIQASAAKTSADATMRSERAWILPDGGKISDLNIIPVPPDLPEGARKTPVSCRIALINCGNTPASAIKWEFELRLGESKEIPPSFDIYKKKPIPSMEVQTPFPIGQNRSQEAVAVLKPYPYITTAEKLEIDAGTKIIWLCGVVRYYDVFKRKHFWQRKPEEHETLICIRNEARIDGSSGTWMIGGPSGYNDAT